MILQHNRHIPTSSTAGTAVADTTTDKARMETVKRRESIFSFLFSFGEIVEIGVMWFWLKEKGMPSHTYTCYSIPCSVEMKHKTYVINTTCI